MSEIFNAEELTDRARDLGALNGFDLVFVELDDTVDPPVARQFGTSYVACHAVEEGRLS